MDNKVRDFIKLTGLAGPTSLIPISLFADENDGTHGHIEKENAKNFSLGQNFPNPYINETTIPFYLNQPSDVILDIYDLQGKKLSSITRNSLPEGDHTILLDMQALDLPTGNYAYQLEVKNIIGTYRDCKMMTAQQ